MTTSRRAAVAATAASLLGACGGVASNDDGGGGAPGQDASGGDRALDDASAGAVQSAGAEGWAGNPFGTGGSGIATGGDQPGVGGTTVLPGQGGFSSLGGVGGISAGGASGSAAVDYECTGAEDCDTALLVPGGTMLLTDDPAYPIVIDSFYLDKCEVTVGRFREFVEQYDGTPPEAGAGAHPLIENSGWDPSWNLNLPATQVELTNALRCEPLHDATGSCYTWTDEAGPNEALPINCVSWYEAFAFCAWDGGRLLTEREYVYAAAGGDELRLHPWGEESVTPDRVVWGCMGNGVTECGFADIVPAGCRPLGNARWGHSDLVGSMFEPVLDWYAEYRDAVLGCDNCANLTPSSGRTILGDGWLFGPDGPYWTTRYEFPPTDRQVDVGVRCARDPQFSGAGGAGGSAGASGAAGRGGLAGSAGALGASGGGGAGMSAGTAGAAAGSGAEGGTAGSTSANGGVGTAGRAGVT